MALQYTPYVTGQNITPEQPVPFSHEHHVGGLGLDCRYCHTSVETVALRRHAADPDLHDLPFAALDQCADAGAGAARAWPSGKPIRWRRVNALPDYVYFDHSVHVAKGVGCTTCHGAGRRHAADAAGRAADHGLVPRLPPRSRAEPAAARAQIFEHDWTPPPDQAEQGRAR